jgi:hypothetical protein
MTWQTTGMHWNAVCVSWRNQSPLLGRLHMKSCTCVTPSRCRRARGRVDVHAAHLWLCASSVSHPEAASPCFLLRVSRMSSDMGSTAARFISVSREYLQISNTPKKKLR